MPLTVGALARRTSLTVRTLHHYDEIGLLKPSARSDAGYRLYSDADVARLHAIQALRHLGLPLAEIAPLLDDPNAPPERILEQQILALDQQIRQATELREQLAILRDGLLKGETPSLDDWVQSLSLMATYGRYFSAGEIRSILGAFGRIEDEWHPLLVEVRACMDSGAAPESEPAQVLARRWAVLMMRWMDNDFSLMDRWGEMYRQEPSAHGLRGAPPTDMMAYMERAIGFRKGLLAQHFGSDRYLRIRPLPDETWLALERAGRELLAAGRAPTSAQAREVRDRWLHLVAQSSGGDEQLCRGMLTLHQGHPLLLAGLPLTREVREFLSQVPDDDGTP